MSDQVAAASQRMSKLPGDVAMARLADRLLEMAPPTAPSGLTALPSTSMPRPSPAVAAALATSAAISARAAERARRSRSVVGMMVDGFVAACSFLPYALVGLALRLTMALVFFLDGQTRIDGPLVPLKVQDFSLSVTLPLGVKAETVNAFLTQIPPLPVPPALAAYVLSYAEFVLPILLLLGFATRFSALALLALTVALQLFVMPQALWTTHIYWASILLVLVSLGPGQLSVNAIIRFIARR
ncbi:MAG TPA: DoxX family membrane protein [Pseudolabrys sp.]|nr:DoxX family membrane protein [Pseudolabrys sp.]